jgi:hypothetical protein
MQKVEFEFPDEKEETTEIEVEASSASDPFDKKNQVVEPESEPELEPEPEKVTDNELDIEVIDDTPKADQGREPSEPPEPVTDEELGEYSAKVKKRLKHFSKGYHDERRAKEVAQRERDEMERLTRQMVEENQRLKSTVGQNQNVMLEHAKKTVERDLALAKQAYKSAYDAGDSENLVKAQEALSQAQIRSEQLKTIKPQPLQQEPDEVQQGQPMPQAAAQQVPPPQVSMPRQPDEKARKWADDNIWFGQDQEMTALALGTHAKLVESGIDPTSDQYYERLNSRMHQVFPEYFGDTDETPPHEAQRRSSQVVAPATRSTAPKKVKLTQTQVALAKRLGIPIEEYAKQVAIEMRKGNG